MIVRPDGSKSYRRLLQSGGALLLLGVFAAIIGSAQAAPSTKNYTANVHVTNGAVSGNTFTLTLTNDLKSNQTLGSANFTPPAGFTLGSASTTHPGFSATVVGNVVQFRSTSALAKGDTVSADVTVTGPALPTTCGSATWSVAAKQSNDFSGSGNDFALKPSDLTPLGSFAIDHIGTVPDALFPTVLTQGNPGFAPFDFKTTALDTCGATKSTYTGANLDYSFLTNATFFSVSANHTFDATDPAAYGSTAWANGVADVRVSPVLTETPNSLTVSDGTTHIASTSNEFDAVDLACTKNTPQCIWTNSNKQITATTASPTTDNTSIGIGFNDLLAPFFTCGGRTKAIGGSIINLDPHFLPAGATTYQVTLTYTKAASGNGPASGFVVCLVHEMPTSSAAWSVPPAGDCPATPTAADAPCVVSKKRISGGALQIILFLKQGDPWPAVG